MELSTFFDFCSGIGGGRLGLEMAGLKSVGYSDTSRLSVITYNILFDNPNDKNYGNLKRIKPETLPQHDVLIAGFPCQTFSVIGRRQGFYDSRGQIIFYIANFLKTNKPKCFILENVKGLVSHDKGKTLSTIINLLKESGYTVVYKILNSIDYIVPHMRQRVYFIGIREDYNKSADKFLFPNPLQKDNLDDYLTCDAPVLDEKIDMSKDDLYEWVKYYYEFVKCEKYFISNYKEDFIIVPIDRLEWYFDIHCTYRIKRSGSSNPTKKTKMKFYQFYQTTTFNQNHLLLMEINAMLTSKMVMRTNLN